MERPLGQQLSQASSTSSLPQASSPTDMPGFSLPIWPRVRKRIEEAAINGGSTYRDVYEAFERRSGAGDTALDAVLQPIEKKWLKKRAVPACSDIPSALKIPASDEARVSLARLRVLNAVVLAFPLEMGEVLASKLVSSRILKIIQSPCVPAHVRMTTITLCARWAVLLKALPKRQAVENLESMVNLFYCRTACAPRTEYLPRTPDVVRLQKGFPYPPMDTISSPDYLYCPPPARPQPVEGRAVHRAVLERRNPNNGVPKQPSNSSHESSSTADSQLELMRAYARDVTSLTKKLLEVLETLTPTEDPRHNDEIRNLTSHINHSYRTVVGYRSRLEPKLSEAAISLKEAQDEALQGLAVFNEAVAAYERRTGKGAGPRPPASQKQQSVEPLGLQPESSAAAAARHAQAAKILAAEDKASSTKSSSTDTGSCGSATASLARKSTKARGKMPAMG